MAWKVLKKVANKLPFLLYNCNILFGYALSIPTAFSAIIFLRLSKA